MVLASFILMLLACGLAWGLGAKPERLGAALLASCWALSLGLQGLAGVRSDVPLAVADGLYAIGLIALASRFDRSWIWVSLVLQAGDLAGHALLLVLRGEDRAACIAFINVTSFGTLLTLALGALFHAYERRRGRSRATAPGVRRPRRSRA